jgi:RNA polymerase sigma-70 factor (ECF subfamily)
MPAIPETRQTLILRLRDAEDADAWREFVEVYEPVIYRVARRQGFQPADACEIVQEVFLSVARAVTDWEPHGPARFRTWLLRIVHGKLIDQFRRRQRNVAGRGGSSVLAQLALAEDQSDALSAEMEREYRLELFHRAAEQVRRRVQPATWQAFWLTTVQAISIEDAAHETGLSVGAVYIARSRVLARLRECVQYVESQ